MRRPATAMTDRELDNLLSAARKRAWPGPDHSPRVEAHLKGSSMKQNAAQTLSRHAIILLAVGALAGGSVATAVTHTIMSRRAVLVTDDGTQYEVQLLESPDGASGTFVTEDGTVFGLEMVQQGAEQRVNVEVTSPTGGTSTVILDDGSAPSVTTLPGQTARIEIQQPATAPADD